MPLRRGSHTWRHTLPADKSVTGTYFHVVAAMGSSTSSRLVGFIADPPCHGKYEAIKALLLKTFSLSAKERACQILDIQGLGDKPSQLMEKMLNLLGGEDPRILFMETFLRHLLSRVQTALDGAPCLG